MEILTVKEAAVELRCSNVKMYELIKQNQISPIRHIGKKILIPRIALDAFILGVKVDVNEILKSLKEDDNQRKPH